MYGVRRARGQGGSLHSILLVMVLLGGCGAPEGDAAIEPSSADTLQVVDDTGRSIHLEGPAMRVLSLLPATTETISALGAANRLVGRTDYDEDPWLAHLPSVGGGLTPSLEAIAVLRPDLVIAWEEAGVARIRPRLEALGIQVFGVRTQDTTAIFANVDRLGHLMGLDRSADSLSATIRERLAAVRSSVDEHERPSVLYMIGLDPPIVAGPNVFIGEILEVAGGRNAFAELSAPSPQVSIEEIVRRRPDVVIVPTEGDRDDVIGRMQGLAGWRDLVGLGEVRVEAIPIDLLHRPGPGIAGAAEALRDVIHPTEGTR